jgi:hypothetical protein
VLVGAGGAALGALALWPFDVGWLGAVIGGANGAVSGWRGIYDWRSWRGWSGAVLDSTWGMVGVLGGLASHVAALFLPPGYVDAMSRRQGRHVYQRGWSPKRGFAFTAGNVISGAGDPTNERRRQLVDRHEMLHVWQQRSFGPIFVVVYAAWMLGGAITGTAVWLRKRGSLYDTVERHAYYYNPFERWAYVHDENWPPRRMRH